MGTPQSLFPQWMRGFLLAAAAYNILWGVFIGWFPETFFHWVTETVCETPSVITWQGRGVLLMAVIYLTCAIHPGKYWFLILFGSITKIAGAIWFYFAILETEIGKRGAFHLLMNDLIWVPLLLWITYQAHQYKKLKP